MIEVKRILLLSKGALLRHISITFQMKTEGKIIFIELQQNILLRYDI